MAKTSALAVDLTETVQSKRVSETRSVLSAESRQHVKLRRVPPTKNLICRFSVSSEEIISEYVSGNGARVKGHRILCVARSEHLQDG